MKLFYIGFFGLIGVYSRYGLSLAFQRWTSFPLGTFVINVLGSLMMGYLFHWGSAKWNLSPELKTGLLVGLLGGFTTFSSFSLETHLLFERQTPVPAILYAVLTPVFCLLAVWIGMKGFRWSA